MRHRVQITVACGLLALVLASAAAPAAASRSIPARVELAELLRPHSARVAPSGYANYVQYVKATRPITGGPTILPVVAHATGYGGRQWLKVLLPGRPNGHAGWILKAGTQYMTSKWRVVVKLHRRHALIYRLGRIIRIFDVVVGKPSTPTPTGNFFIEESVRESPGAPGGPFALALSARSNVFSEFAGGPGQVALHGRDNLGGVLGTAVSHGCVRFADSAIRWMEVHLGPGVPVTIRR
jgi:hypothetical protein